MLSYSFDQKVDCSQKKGICFIPVLFENGCECPFSVLTQHFESSYSVLYYMWYVHVSVKCKVHCRSKMIVCMIFCLFLAITFLIHKHIIYVVNKILSTN